MAGGTNTERKKWGMYITVYTIIQCKCMRQREKERDLPGVQDSQNPHQESKETLPVKVVGLHIVITGGRGGSIFGDNYVLNIRVACFVYSDMI